MHEMSIALGIVRIAEDEVAKAGARKVNSIDLDIGTLSGIELDSLEFVWPVAVKETVLEGATKNINIIQGKGYCMDCAIEFDMQNFADICPTCHGLLKEIRQGKEMRVKALEVE
jgi:hydrogenase nickel incorporation protein HypA/HybF